MSSGKMQSENYNCPECQEDLDYDPQGYPCEKCEWWLEASHKEEQQRYERMMWEREEWEKEFGPDGLGPRRK